MPRDFFDSWKVSAALVGRQASTELWSLLQDSGHAVTILCSCEVTERHGFVIYRCRPKRLSGWVKIWEESCVCFLQLQNNADLWNVQKKNYEAITLRVKMVFRIKCVFSKTFSCSVEHHHGECVWETEQGDGTGLLLRHVDELPVRYRCHVLSQLARNTLTA